MFALALTSEVVLVGISVVVVLWLLNSIFGNRLTNRGARIRAERRAEKSQRQRERRARLARLEEDEERR